MLNCEICGRAFESFKKLSSHIWQAHKNEIKLEEYYLKFIGEKGKCEICGLEYKNLLSLSVHISRSHEMKSEEYYLKFIGEKGKCIECGKDTNFVSLGEGYRKFCSKKCSNNSIEVKNKRKQTCLEKSGYEYPSQNSEIKKRQQESTLRNNNGIHPNILTYKKLKEKYPLLVKVEELIEGPNGEILAHCKNSKCKNSKENDGYFEPTIYQLNWRKQGIDKNDTYYFYCCEECKHECPLYWRSASTLHNLITEDPEKLYNSSELSIWRKEVFIRQLRKNPEHIENYCEICGSTENLQAHHIQPIKLYPEYALDPENGLVVCEKCHYEKCHKKGTECSTGNLANKICN